ncbi:MAG: SagB/ThcOx family dehydrogenase [Deltaproteobacteria bacterium]|jgi:SagB-type dehydrogenase family enzyme|nr:SagB/ThcOx family dehydrogenase [Deltaproteobacteria bacterium]MBW2531179.1 SagB/ThcOx family dehydrogenase [Deltaproteobacteria bacterium]
MERSDALAGAIRYHDRTKHRPGRFARSLGYMDWDTQPDPFRRYEGAPSLRLDEVAPTESPTFDQLYTPQALACRAVDRAAISQLLYDSMALSAWKSYGGERWSLRCNPSSGNLHPTETYLIAAGIDELSSQPGLYHYDVLHHALERRATLPDDLWSALAAELPGASLLIGLSSIHWREAWKYGERAFRYCQHDVGHAIAAIAMAAAPLGWQVQLLDGPGDAECGTLLGIEDQRGDEAEAADALLLVTTAGEPTAATRDRIRSWRPPAAAIDALRQLELAGTPNQLSSSHHRWPVIDEAAAASAYPGGAGSEAPRSTPTAAASVDATVAPGLCPALGSGRRILRDRRSAVAMDGSTSMDRASFYRLLCRTLPAPATPPLAALSWRPAIHLVLFVHRVAGLDRGVYALVRDPAALEPFRSALDRGFTWELAPDAPAGLPLYRIDEGDVRLAARQLSCDQAIASDGAFAVAMIAELEPRLQDNGPWFYRRLFWEAGAVGQILYLEAEAAGLRGTGIGCFFDDAVHEVLGLSGHRYQSLYHFTVGGPVHDPRLRTLPPYAHR